MKTLFHPDEAQEIQARLAAMSLANQRLWGVMQPAQALAHCSTLMEWAVGDIVPKRSLIGRIVGPLVRSKVCGDDKPLHRSTPTDPTLVIKEERDLDTERKRLAGLIDRFVAGGSACCTTHPHSFFGTLTPDQWGVLMYKHLDHHFRQFGA